MYDYRKEMILEMLRKDCANCGKPKSGTMSSTSWGHDYPCCSDRCGKRLGKRFKNGMFAPSIRNNSFDLFNDSDDEKIERLRIRIKHLESQLKRNGFKPIKHTQ